MFMADRDFAREQNNSAAAIQATERIAKLHGFTLDGKGRELFEAEKKAMVTAVQPAGQSQPTAKPEGDNVVPFFDVEELRQRYGVPARPTNPLTDSA